MEKKAAQAKSTPSQPKEDSPDSTPQINPETTDKKTPQTVTETAEQSVPPEAQPKQFFDDFSPVSKNPFNKLFLIPLALILVVAIYLLKPTIENFFKPTKALDVYLPVSQEPKSMHLLINNPDDQILTYDATMVVSGQTTPKAGVVISVQFPNSTFKDQNIGVEADNEGGFRKSVDLKPGANEISISAFDTQGNKKMETREIYYSQEKL
jgi:hypothetical protein